MAIGATFTDVAPVVPVLDLDAALERYQRLGFTVHRSDHDRYGFVGRDTVSLHITEWAEHNPKLTGAVVYLYVSNADAVHSAWAAAGVEGKLTDPADAEHGLREFTFVDVDGTQHFVGSPL